MKKSTKVRLIIAVCLIVLSTGISLSITKSAVHYADTELGNELAIQQMENTDESSMAYEEYRNVRNDMNSLLPAVVNITSGFAVILLLLPELKNKKEKE